MHPLQALFNFHLATEARTRAIAHLGLPHARRGRFDPALLPPPSLVEPNSKSKDPHVFCVVTGGRLVQLRSPMSYGYGRKTTHDLVRIGLSPLDILIATIDFRRYDAGDEDGAFVFRDAVEWLFWDWRDQWRLDREADNA